MKFICQNINSSKYFPFCVLFFLASTCIRGQELDSILQHKLADNYIEKGKSFKYTNFDSCLIYRLKAEKIFYRLEAWPDNIDALNRAANSYYDLGMISKAKEVSDSVLVLADTKLDSMDPVLVPVYNTALVLYRNLGLYDLSKELGHKALAIPLKIKSDYFKSVVQEQCSKTYLLTGDYETARHHADMSISLSRDTFGFQHFQNAESYYCKALVNQRLEKYPEAIESLKSAIQNVINDREKVAVNRNYYKFLVRLSEIYCLNSNFIEAKRVLEKLENNIGEVKGRNRAEYYLAKAMYIFKSGDGDLSYAKKLLKASNEMYYSISISKGTDQKFLENLSILSEIFKAENNNEEAKSYLTAALDSMGVSSVLLEPNKIERKILTLELLDKLLDYSLIEEDEVSSEYYIECITNIVRDVRLHNNTESYKNYWAKTNLKTNEKIVKHYVSIGDLESAFNFMEENKSNILVNDIKENMADGYAGIPNELLDKEFQLMSDIGVLDKMIFDLQDLGQEQVVQEVKLKELSIDREKHRVELAKLKKEFKERYSSYYNIKYSEDKLYIKDIQRNLDSKTLFIEYFVGAESTFVCFISKGDIVIREIDFSRSIQDAILSFYGKLSEPGTENYEASSNLIYNSLLGQDFRTFYKGIDNLIIVPDDLLNNIPFSALSDVDGHLLLEDFNVRYQYSYKLGKLLKGKNSISSQYDFVGYSYESKINVYASERSCSDESQYNLICSSKEVNSIINLLEGKKSKLVTEGMQAFLDAGKHSKVLHLATHACLDETNPKFSRIYFNDGYMTNVDLKLESIPSDLVVLSACETGYGKIIKGEGSMSLSKGFFHAGAKSTVVSLWSVDDCTTAQIMQNFYSNLQEGYTKSEALRHAKLKFWNNANAHQKHPYFWSGFVLIGDNSALWSNGYNLTLMLCGIALLLMALFYFFQRKASKH